MNIRTFAPAFVAVVLLSFTGFVAGADEDDDDLTVEEVAELYEEQWKDVDAMRIEFKRETRTRVTTNRYDSCSWEMVGEKAKVVESRLTSFPSDPRVADSRPVTANVISECYYDGEKTYEIAEPVDSWPLESVKLADYETLRRQGVRATISNHNKHWRFWYSCPIPRFFSIPAESELLSLPELVAKYDSKIVKIARTDRGEKLVQLEIHGDVLSGAFSSMFKSWTLYLSLNVEKNFAAAGYQLSVTLNRQPEEKIITEYSVDAFKEFQRGIWLPTNVEYREHTGGMRSSLTKIAIRGVSINVPSADFDNFHFLPGMVVNEEVWSEDRSEKRPKVLVHIWGQDDAPERSFGSEEEFLQFFSENFGFDPWVDEEDPKFKIMGRRRNTLLFLGACFCLLAFTALVVYTRRAVKKDQESEGM